jgi:hypothetical protein
MVFIALLLVTAGGLYIRLRWRRAPQAYRAMITLALGYFIAGALAATWVMHRAAPRPAEVVSTSPSAPVSAVTSTACSMSFRSRQVTRHVRSAMRTFHYIRYLFVK